MQGRHQKRWKINNNRYIHTDRKGKQKKCYRCEVRTGLEIDSDHYAVVVELISSLCKRMVEERVTEVVPTIQYENIKQTQEKCKKDKWRLT